MKLMETNVPLSYKNIHYNPLPPIAITKCWSRAYAKYFARAVVEVWGKTRERERQREGETE